MNQDIFGKCIRGASHIRAEIPCQDSIKICNNKYHDKRKRNYFSQLDDDISIISIADGHGSRLCPYSKNGSSIATNVFCDIMAELCVKYKDNMIDSFLPYLNREGDTQIAKTIDLEWERRVLIKHQIERRPIPLDANGEKDIISIRQQYGTTLLGLLITRDFKFLFQLGDGNINFVSKAGVIPLLNPETMLGVETHSLAKKNSWKNVLTRVVDNEELPELPYLYMLTTDGMTNSFVSKAEFYKNCLGYFEAILMHGSEAVNNNLDNWLSETSSLGCGDDITAAFAFFK